MTSSSPPGPAQVDCRLPDPAPFVTVLMPVRNERDFIEAAVLGVLDADHRLNDTGAQFGSALIHY